MAGLTSLQSLDLSGCGQLSGDLAPLAYLTSLESLNLFNCSKLSGDLFSLAKLTSLQSLELSLCQQLSGDLSPLAHITSLQSLELSFCQQFSGDLSSLAKLTSLQSLKLPGRYSKLSDDLSPLAGLTSLQWLDLSLCDGIRRVAPLESLLPTLKELHLFNCKFDDLPSEVCGENLLQNVLDKVRAHYGDLKTGRRVDAEVKVFFLGNGGVGKTQLCRRLRDLPFDPTVPTTHGVQLGQTTVEMDGFPEPVRLNLWDSTRTLRRSRKKILPLLRGYGRFSRAGLETLIWSDYTPEEQKVFLDMMERWSLFDGRRRFRAAASEDYWDKRWSNHFFWSATA